MLECPDCSKKLAEYSEHMPKCPTRSSYDVEPIGSLETVCSFAIKGIGSKELGKSYKCNNCGYKW